ncbi:MAG: hypothetical protein A2268_04910 [Candidatus Raymondbacteria bacterium RifOxyA12_full_50_37]|uniref:HhH-GPD domain-containing protein n=1 Tax=Candidatus Raymondbacteria bacterium RIFOXYD12_FULL_49_13 TaxID=1817890 RepID=A0A1F7FD71_UNCRA|nr:MAG: hypothetical protein A2268_04910 [Candidatus Raymondbacteria bacterium RifOxyA12_full_50_37]OGJ94084.1 MAG: hypothetical protein A2248_12115 [Candidatus Raymondbacteria bacterium RIFOXYA2_FULL_49_16]OGJ96839.1 MAG: hypothetical protein A2487_07205 [Candidatus Raymondbacteria bacterium RifOxyC12_full_50_8]OGJ96909.1 MAG: hypothetical protein A2453_04715 [Candidatus Raymondbacteria bacterium RIFOXYC2_FULL_50_21]OGK03011.1 MAG: hypothetical protein A2350_03580 [Candidatus Raymondbacteria b
MATIPGIYRLLNAWYGDCGWWPGHSRLEIIIGAILTQNTAWSNVEKAIASLKQYRLLSLARLRVILCARLARHIRPSGYFNQKSKRIKNFITFLDTRYRGSLRVMAAAPTADLREQLLCINGIGPETADSILLYACDKPVFVVDAYTRRIFSRMGLLKEDETYDAIQRFFEKRMRSDIRVYNQYHALIVNVGKDFCRKLDPRCGTCPLGKECAWQG